MYTHIIHTVTDMLQCAPPVVDSFYGKLSSTPAASATTSSHPSSAVVDLHHNLSLCSDDGLPDVLNDDRCAAWGGYVCVPVMYSPLPLSHRCDISTEDT